MNVGDLVNFRAHSWVFKSAERDYENPGIVLRVTKDLNSSKRVSAEVMWADKKITSEHECYLEIVEVVSESSD